MKKVLVKYSIFTGMLIAVHLSGCGVKGNPVTLSTATDRTQIMQNLKASASDKAVNLSWDYRNNEHNKGFIVIEKSELGSAGNECKDCPKTYERIGQISLKSIDKKSTGGNNNFTDEKVTHGKTYYYRLIFCDDFNACFENDVTEINY